MNEFLGGLQDLKCMAYLDDILIYGRTFEEHLENLKAVLKGLKEKGIKLNAKNCHFFKREVKYLGRLISKDGYRADSQDSIALEKFRAPPKTVFLKLDKAKGGFEYVLVVTDHFTRYVQAFAIKTKSAKAAAEKLYNNYILTYGFPSQIHHDCGREFHNSLSAKSHQLSGVKSSKTTPYHPSGADRLSG